MLRAVATHGVAASPLAGLFLSANRSAHYRWTPSGRSDHERIALSISPTKPPARFNGVRDDNLRRIATTEGGIRTMLFVPSCVRDDLVIGWIAGKPTGGAAIFR